MSIKAGTLQISKLKAGQSVLAADTKSGKDRVEPVVAVLVHRDTDLYDLTVRAGHRTAVIDTTSSHLFWDASSRRWVKAAALKYGTRLRTPGGGTATVLGGSVPRAHTGWMWDLTVTRDHDFYIQAAITTILVHNEMCRDLPSPFGKDTFAVIGRRPDINVARPWDNHEVLTLSPWSATRNDEWIQGIIAKGQKVYLASPINDVSLFDPVTSGPYGQTLYAREMNQLLEGGYTFEGEDYMIPTASHG